MGTRARGRRNFKVFPEDMMAAQMDESAAVESFTDNPRDPEELGVPQIPQDDDETEWEAELPPPDPVDVEAALAHTLTHRDPLEEDIDRLWDWIRQDEDRGYAFLGIRPATSADLRDQLSRTFPNFYALDDDHGKDKKHIGFGAVGNVVAGMAPLHLYLSPDARGRIQVLMPQLLRLVSEQFPQIDTFGILTPDSTAARLYKSAGFDIKFILTWSPVRAVNITPEN